VSTVRSEKKDKISGLIQNYYVSEDWRKSTSNQEINVYPAFNLKDKTGTQIYFCNPSYSPGAVYYGMPSYIGVIYWACADFKISEYHNSCLDNGFAPSMLLNFNNGVPTEEQAQEMYAELNKQFA